MPYFATVVRQQRAAHPHALLLDAGGWASGTALSDAFEGAPMIEVMDELGYGAAAIGETDLEFGLDTLFARAEQARFPLLSANLVDPMRRRLPGIAPFALLETGGVKVGVIGLSCDACEKAGKTRVIDPREALMESMFALRGGNPHVFVVLSHLGLDADRALAAATPGIHCIIGAHGDAVSGSPERVGETVIARCAPRAQALGALTLTLAGAIEGHTQFGPPPQHESERRTR